MSEEAQGAATLDEVMGQVAAIAEDLDDLRAEVDAMDDAVGLRVMALQHAAALLSHQSKPEPIIDAARLFYAFLNGADGDCVPILKAV